MPDILKEGLAQAQVTWQLLIGKMLKRKGGKGRVSAYYSFFIDTFDFQ